MKKLILLFFIFSIFTGLIYSQPASQLANDNLPFIKGNEGLIGAQCVGGLIYDDNTWENGYGWNPGYGIGKWVLKMTPAIYPFTINQVCFALTRTAAGSANFTFDIIFYDATGTGGGPGTLVHTIANQTATGVPVWPTVSWFDFTGLTGVPPLNSGQSYYVGYSYNPATMPSHYVGADESATTQQRPGYGYNQSAWGTIQSFFPSYKAIGVRADGNGPTFVHNIAAGPFLSLPILFNTWATKVIKAKVTNQGTSNESNIPMKFFVNGTLVSTSTIATLNAGSVDSVSYNWTPTATGSFNLKIVSALANDEYRANDTVSATVQVYPPGYYSVCIGTGTTAVGYPFYTFYMDSRTTMLYTAAEIGTGACPLYKIGFDVVVPNPQVMNGFKVKMQNTTTTTLTSFGTGMTEVYTGTYSVTGTGWQWITFTSLFPYTGQNLLVEICFNNSSYTSSSTVRSTSATGKCYHAHSDISAGDGCVQISTGELQSTRPNICLLGSVWVGNQDPNEIPKEYSLSQNYPNPFNPKTIINYQLPMNSNVKLVIFDVLGKVVATLVNEQQTPGTYEVEWDAANYSSGLYFYKLECDGFSDVKKMLIIK